MAERSLYYTVDKHNDITQIFVENVFPGISLISYYIAMYITNNLRE